MITRLVFLTATVLLASLGSATAGQSQAPGATTSGTRATEVVLRPGDVLRITVWPDSDMSGEFVVEDTGYLYLPLLGGVRVGGMTIDRVRTELRQGYGEVMRNPVVSVTAVYPVTITGEVQRPGIHMITPTNGLFDVIGMAGGFRPGADPENLRVVRPGQVIEFDALRALETGEGMDAIQLRSGDHIVVPQQMPSLLSWRNAMTLLQTVSLIAFSLQRLLR